MNFFIAQIFGICGSIFVMFASIMKTKSKYLISYIFAYIFFISNMILLKAYSGALNNFIVMILTIISIKFENKKFPVYVIIIFGIVILIGNIFCFVNIYSLLPALASFIYLAILVLNDMKILRKLTVFLRLSWMIYDFIIKAFSTFVFDIISFIISIIAVFRFYNKE